MQIVMQCVGHVTVKCHCKGIKNDDLLRCLIRLAVPCPNGAIFLQLNMSTHNTKYIYKNA